MYKMAKGLVFVLFFALALTVLSDRPKDRVKEMNKEVEAILASAKKDENGKVTVEEYGRLLAGVLKAKEVHKKVLNVLTLAKNYVETLSGPQDPDNLIKELNSGPLWEMIQKELGKGRDRKRPIKQDL